MSNNTNKHWFHQLSESGKATVDIEDWERNARELEELTLRIKELKKEQHQLDKEIYADLRKDWPLDEIYESIRRWKKPDWWIPF